MERELEEIRELLDAGAVIIEMVNEPGCCELVLHLRDGCVRRFCWPDRDHLDAVIPCVTARLV